MFLLQVWRGHNGAIHLIAIRGNGVHSVTYMPGMATVVGHHSFLREEPCIVLFNYEVRAL